MLSPVARPQSHTHSSIAHKARCSSTGQGFPISRIHVLTNRLHRPRNLNMPGPDSSLDSLRGSASTTPLIPSQKIKLTFLFHSRRTGLGALRHDSCMGPRGQCSSTPSCTRSQQCAYPFPTTSSRLYGGKHICPQVLMTLLRTQI